jgi:hypothetical protein
MCRTAIKPNQNAIHLIGTRFPISQSRRGAAPQHIRKSQSHHGAKADLQKVAPRYPGAIALQIFVHG